MSYTNEGLVDHVKNALKLKTKYMWAGTLSLITDAYITQKLKQCIDGNVPATRTGYTAARVKALRSIAGKVSKLEIVNTLLVLMQMIPFLEPCLLK